jgi:DNA-binding response OmpR family regulator
MTRRILLVQTIDGMVPPSLFGEASFDVRRVAELSDVMRSAPDFRPAVIVFEIRSWRESMEDLFRQLSSRRSTQSIRKFVLVHKAVAADAVKALELGADDFILKPVSSRELLARLNAVMRSCRPHDEYENLSLGRLSLHRKEMEVSVRERRIKLSRTEFNLLAYFLDKSGCVISREELLENLWWPERMVEGPRIVDVYVSRLRAIIEDEPGFPSMLLTRRGEGYVLVDPNVAQTELRVQLVSNSKE